MWWSFALQLYYLLFLFADCSHEVLYIFSSFNKEPIKVAKPKPKKTFEEQKKTEKTKVELKRRIPQEFHDFAERKISAALSHIPTFRLTQKADTPPPKICEIALWLICRFLLRLIFISPKVCAPVHQRTYQKD